VPAIAALGIRAVVAPTLMTTLDERVELARTCLSLFGG